MFDIRPAVEGDAEGIARVHLQGWRESYTGLIPEEVFEHRERDIEGRVAAWRALVAKGEEGVLVAVAEDGRVVGWATHGSGRDEDRPYPRELNGLYTLRETQGRGLGRALLEAAIGTTEGAYLWTLAGNVRAQAFYRHLGFDLDGGAKEWEIAGHALQELRMVRHPDPRGPRS